MYVFVPVQPQASQVPSNLGSKLTADYNHASEQRDSITASCHLARQMENSSWGLDMFVWYIDYFFCIEGVGWTENPALSPFLWMLGINSFD